MFSQLGAFGVEDGRLGRRRPLSAADPLGDDPRLGRGGDRLDRLDQLRRRPGGRLQERRSNSVFNWLVDAGVGLTAALRLTDTIFMLLCFAGVGLVYLLGVRGMRTVPRRAARWRSCARLRPHADPDRPRLPRRPLLQPLRLPGAGPVHLPALRPAGHRRPPTSSAPPRAASTSTSSAPTRSGTSRSAPSSSATCSASPSPTTAPSSTGPTTARPPAPSTGCWR